MRAVGEMPEWPNGTDSKSVVPSPVPRVRIPISPPLFEKPRKSLIYGAFLCALIFAFGLIGDSKFELGMPTRMEMC